MKCMVFTVSGIKVGFNDPLLQVTEGVNSSINVCGFVSNPTRIQGSILTAIITTAPSTAKGLKYLRVYYHRFTIYS